MKNINIISIVICSTILFISSCSSHWLDKGYEGERVTEEQVTVDALINGILASLYERNADGHDSFGQRSFDLATDILSGDIAIKEYGAGWFLSDEQMETASNRTGEVWAYYFGMLRSTNNAIRILDVQGGIKMKYATNGNPNSDENIANQTYSEQDVINALNYARALTLRGFALSKLAMFYTPARGDEATAVSDVTTYRCAPIYDETNLNTPQPISSSERVFHKSFENLELAIQLFEEFSSYYTTVFKGTVMRDSKLDVDEDIARGILAYAYLNLAPYYYDDTKREAMYTKALQTAEAIITKGHFSLLTQEKLYSTGFNNVNEDCWMWGQDVTTETTTRLASWFGNVDLYTYSYARTDPKRIDATLYSSIPAWDGRKNWFDDNSLCPTNKFYSAINRSLDDDKLDREWLSDNIFMRYESIYLIASEAACQLNILDKAKDYLTAITDLRMNLTYPSYATEYQTFKDGLTTQTALQNAITYNWRMEMWGEGYGFQTLKRLSHKSDRGSNHAISSGVVFDATEAYYLFQIPTSESTYNTRFNDPVLTLEN